MLDFFERSIALKICRFFSANVCFLLGGVPEFEVLMTAALPDGDDVVVVDGAAVASLSC